MELSNAQKEAAIAQIVAREEAVDRDPSLESMRDVDCCGLRGELAVTEGTGRASHTRGGFVFREPSFAQTEVILRGQVEV